MALQTKGGVPKTGYSQVVNVLLPERPQWLASDAQWSEYAEDFSEVDPDTWEADDTDYDAWGDLNEGYDDLAWLEGEYSDGEVADGDVGWGQEGLKEGDGLADGEGRCPHCGGT